MKISLFEILGFSKLKKPKLQYLSMGKYFEGYYCKDDNSVNGISTDSSREILDAISRSYPSGITTTEISNQTHTSANTVYNSLKSLEAAGFIIKIKPKTSRGRPGKTDVQDDVRSYRFHIENRNFALKDDNYQFAPGYTKYTSDFLYASNQLVEKNQLDDVYSPLIKILRQAMTKITSSGDPTLKRLVPNPDKSMQCQFCGVNHDARDFIRATLLHILDQFETSSMFKDFFNEQQFISKDMNLTPMQEKSKIEEQAKEWLVNLTPEAKGITESIVERSTFLLFCPVLCSLSLCPSNKGFVHDCVCHRKKHQDR
jgi:DNA-binding Lrp family transcriptional regulator